MKGSGIKFVEVDSEYSGRVSNMLKNSRPIQAFPTLLAIKGGAVINEFAGERTHEGLTNFVKQNFSKGGRRRKTRKKRRKRRHTRKRRKTRRRRRRKN
jgi:thioredoxin-like negative regulator of GroEL